MSLQRVNKETERILDIKKKTTGLSKTKLIEAGIKKIEFMPLDEIINKRRGKK